MMESMRKIGLLAIGAILITGILPLHRVDAAGFTLYDGTSTTPIFMDAQYGGPYNDRAYRQVFRAVQDLRQDIAMVTGAIDAREAQAQFMINAELQQERLSAADPKKLPALRTAATQASSAIIIGVIGQSALIDSIIAAGKFDEAKEITGNWEGFAIKTVPSPVDGIGKALVIAGSDARGTIYGIYSLSEEIGVSPWYWLSDVPVFQRDTIVVDATTRVNKGPDVQFRGFFINDEERMIDWAKLKFPRDQGTPDVNLYRHVFESMLRARLNTLWPAMHEGTRGFNVATHTGIYDGGTPINAEAAADFGIIMSSSHCEQMLRNNVDEWGAFVRRNRERLNMPHGSYDYSTNKEGVLAYWRERMQANAAFESIPVLGIRGVHDGAPSFNGNNPHGFKNVIEMIADAIKEQRKIIADIYGSPDAIPQVFIPYKEMNHYYNTGLREHVPEDVILMWANDNFGHLRQVPTVSERSRPGGSGVYIHSSYWGRPKSYLWLNSTPAPLLIQQLRRAWRSGAGRYWIMNVGAIKPGEMKIEIFSRLAWNVDGNYDEDLEKQYLEKQIARDFGLTDTAAEVVLDALARFTRLETIKRAEFWGTDTPGGIRYASLWHKLSYPPSATSDGDELQHIINEANELVRVLERASERLDEQYRSAFYQQILFRVSSWRNMAEQLGYFWKNQLYATQGRYLSAEVYADLSRRARDRIRSDQAFWDSISGGKWEKALGYSHPISYYGGQNQGVVMLTDAHYASVANPSNGVSTNAEGSEVPGTGALRFNAAAPEDARFFDVFSLTPAAMAWQARTDAPWIILSQIKGKTTTEQRVIVTVDWSKLDTSADGTIAVYNVEGDDTVAPPVAIFTVHAVRSGVDLTSKRGHLEANGYVAIEAEHYSHHVPGTDGSEWRVQKRMGRRAHAMMSYPEAATRVDADFGNTAQLRYNIYFTSTGTFTGTFYRIPTLNEGREDDGTPRTAATAIGLNDEIPTAANLQGESSTGRRGGRWAWNIMRQHEPLPFTITVPEPGWHELVVYRSDGAIVFERIVIETIPGAAGNSLTGPAESPNSIAPRAAATVAPLPPEVQQREAYHGSITNYTDSAGINWQAHIFTQSGGLTIKRPVEVEYLIVGGGGAGGGVNFNRAGGGGGAGGVIHGSTNLTAGTHAISVGVGGAATSDDRGLSGGNSFAFGLTAFGGGAGGSNQSSTTSGLDGGSGGGGASARNGEAGATIQQHGGLGNAGAQGLEAHGAEERGGGGGGAAAPASGIQGGAGIVFNITGQPIEYARGGDARYRAQGAFDGADAPDQTGSGGGGASRSGSGSSRGGNGGSGIVVIRYRLQ
jgi:hypothetical protein